MNGRYVWTMLANSVCYVRVFTVGLDRPISATATRGHGELDALATSPRRILVNEDESREDNNSAA